MHIVIVSLKKCFLVAGLLSWDMENCHVDLEKELEAITSVGPEGEEARHGKQDNNIY